MKLQQRSIFVFTVLFLLLTAIAYMQSLSIALSILNLCLISAVMALGVNIQWGYAGLFNVGIMGFAALGGLSVVLISASPVPEAIHAGGSNMLGVLLIISITIMLILIVQKYMKNTFIILSVIAIGYIFARILYSEGSFAIESINPSFTGYLGGLGLPVLLSWIVGGIIAASFAWGIGKITLGLRSDYLAIATLGISEIVLAIIKNEDWLSRGVKNVSALPRPTPYELDLQRSQWFIDIVHTFYKNTINTLPLDDRVQAFTNAVNDFSIIAVKMMYAGLFVVVLIALVVLANMAIRSPWGRMIRAIRDNEVAASAMGKDVKKYRLQIFIIGSAIAGLAGAMLVTYDGQFTPGSYNPLRYTFLIWVMVIVGGSGNNLGSVVGGFVIWLTWIESEPFAFYMVDVITNIMSDTSIITQHLQANAQYMRLIIMGTILLVVMRFSPKGILPEPTYTHTLPALDKSNKQYYKR